MSIRRTLSFLLVTGCFSFAQGQQPDSVLIKSDPYLMELDSLLAQKDATSILALLDSLINLPSPSIKSQMLVRLGYNSNVVSASRTLGFNQFGLAPGLSYYHKSGLYADVTGYWSPEYDPNYYLTVASLGYLNSPTAWWSFMAEYNQYMYSLTKEDTYIAYKNSLGISNFFDVKPVTFRFDYQYFFGDKKAHRISPSVMLTLEKKNIGKVNRISFFPTVSVLLGSEQITEMVPYTRTLIGIVYRIRNGLPLYYEKQTTEFGALNYSFSAPISITVQKWTFMLSYTYNIPKALPGETIDLVNSGYLSASLTRRITF